MSFIRSPDKKFPFQAQRLGKWIFTFTNQAEGAPIIDSCFIHDIEGNVYQGHAIHLSPWRKNPWGDRKIGLALVIGKRLHA